MRRLIKCVDPIRMGSLLSLFILASPVGDAQTAMNEKKPEYNKWSLELAGGFSNAVGPYTPGYYTNLLNLSNVQLGGRYMANRYFGVKLDAEYDRFKNSSSWKGNNSLPFRTNYFRFSLQGVANLHHVLHFDEWTKHIGLQVHGGAGYSTMGNDSISPFAKGRNMGNLIIGISPIFKINDRFTIKLDASGIKHMHRKYTMDMNESRKTRGADGFIGTLTLGLQINLGKAKEHADWYFNKPNPVENQEIRDMKNRLEKLEEMHGDGDLDGVPNYLDKELATLAGSKVDAFGVTIPERLDSDKDGVFDDMDKCPREFGVLAYNGCPIPDTDGDGILDDRDECPKIKGVAENNGCPKIEKEEQEIINTAFNNLEFMTGKAIILKSSYKSLNDLAALLQKKQEWGLLISGHTDNVGDDAKNMVLSKERAEAVKDYLTIKGIAANRLEVLYYGETKPIALNDMEEGRQKNRRVEMKITF
nr:OmpA family protein [uncultured Fluviicola sp.]